MTDKKEETLLKGEKVIVNRNRTSPACCLFEFVCPICLGKDALLWMPDIGEIFYCADCTAQLQVEEIK